MYRERQNSILRITELLARWLAKIRLNSAIAHYDINKVAENISSLLLNEIYDYRLSNLNTTPNFPSIDLGSLDHGVCFQITSRNDYSKIEDTLRLFISKNLYKEYPQLKFLILNQNEIKFPRDSPVTYAKIEFTAETYNEIKEHTDAYEIKFEDQIQAEEEKQEKIIAEAKKKKRQPPDFIPRFSLVLHRLKTLIGEIFISEKEFEKQVTLIYKDASSKYMPFIKAKTNIEPIAFKRNEDVLSDKILISEIERIQTADAEKFNRIYELLEKEFGDENNTLFNKFFFWSSTALESIKDRNSETINILEEIIIPKYLKSQREHFFYSSKTFLDENPQPFYNTYFPISINSENIKIKHVNAVKLFKDSDYYTTNFITIIGSAGSGKSTLIRHLFINSIDNYVGIPIIIEFRKLNDFNGSISEFVCKTCFYQEISAEDNILHDFFKLGKIIFMFDGYDELFASYKQQKLAELEVFIRTYDKNRFIITSRPGTNINRFNRFNNTSVLDLTKDEVFDFIRQQVKMPEVALKIQKNIQEPENIHFMEYLKNPLLLSMYILTNKKNPEVPKQKKEFYQNIFLTLYVWHDSHSKDSYKREKLTKLQRSDFEIILQRFSLKSYFNGKFEFENFYIDNLFDEIKKNSFFMFENDELLHDLSVNISILLQDCGIYKFPHRSLQEFFTANCIYNFKDEEKIKIFSEKIDLIKKSSFDSLLNLLELCNEFDNYYLTKYFLLRKLSTIFKFENNNKINHAKDLFISLINQFNIVFEVKLKPQKRSIIPTIQEVFLNYTALEDIYIFHFLNMSHSTSFWINPSDRPALSILMHRLGIDDTKTAIPLMQIVYYEDNFDLLQKIGLVNFIIEEYGKAYAKFIELQEKISLLDNADKMWLKNI